MIYVVGCNHGIQPRDEDWLRGDTPEARDQKSRFTKVIAETIKEGEIQFVGEEWGRVETTIAHELAENCGIPWANINTSTADLKRMGIPCDYVKGPFTPEQKERWHRQREQFMLRRIQENRGAAQNLLIVCGFEHLQPLSDLLRRGGTTVAPVDYRELDWYQPGIFSEDP
jgi:hypothetical protein